MYTDDQRWPVGRVVVVGLIGRKRNEVSWTDLHGLAGDSDLDPPIDDDGMFDHTGAVTVGVPVRPVVDRGDVDLDLPVDLPARRRREM